MNTIQRGRLNKAADFSDINQALFIILCFPRCFQSSIQTRARAYNKGWKQKTRAFPRNSEAEHKRRRHRADEATYAAISSSHGGGNGSLTPCATAITPCNVASPSHYFIKTNFFGSFRARQFFFTPRAPHALSRESVVSKRYVKCICISVYVCVCVFVCFCV